MVAFAPAPQNSASRSRIPRSSADLRSWANEAAVRRSNSGSFESADRACASHLRIAGQSGLGLLVRLRFSVLIGTGFTLFRHDQPGFGVDLDFDDIRRS